MKILIIFRGLNVRIRDGVPQSALNCINNWNNSIFNDLKENDINYDIALYTYDSPILNQLVDVLKPIKVVKEGYTDQYGCLDAVTNYMVEQKNNYDRVIILRYDFKYRIKITKWKKWDQKGIIVVNPDVHWLMPRRRYVADIVFIVDKESITTFYDAIRYPGRLHAHTVGTYLFNNNIPFHFMYDQYQHMTKNPLHSHDQFEEEPDLDQEYQSFVIDIVDFWRIRGVDIYNCPNY